MTIIMNSSKPFVVVTVAQSSLGGGVGTCQKFGNGVQLSPINLKMKFFDLHTLHVFERDLRVTQCLFFDPV